ncbi:amino acid ABC transporter permease [Sphingomonadaceae bacterium OTU29THOMA1]|nr:amino acid ABC transporter permease [Sphingomonadaceae bacterium OTU29THOMA1]
MTGAFNLRLRALYGDVWSALSSLLLLGALALSIPRLLDWAITRAVWQGNGTDCDDGGACWAFLQAKLPFILFGIYPAVERWRPVLVIAVILLLALWSLPRGNWTRTTLLLWVVGIAAALMLMGGGVAGLSTVPTEAWGGLPVTLILTVISLALGLPLGIALALARRSTMPVFRWGATALIEIVRALPLLTLLFIAALMTPLILPDRISPDNLMRASFALTLSAGVYFAEVIRGGLQGVAGSQEEASRALGLSWADSMKSVILPQALGKVLPPLTNTVILIVKNTSLVMIIGLFDLLSAGRVALSDPAWPMPFAETYLTIAAIYFAICFGLARYARHLEGMRR